MKCPNCETENNPKDKTCLNCGKPLPATAANTARSVRLRKCLQCGTEHGPGFCPACGRWNGPPPGGIIFIAVFSMANAVGLIILALLFLLMIEKIDIAAAAMAMAIVMVACGNLIAAINLLRLRQWAVIAYRIVLIVGIVAVPIISIVLMINNPNPLNLINPLVSIGANVFMLSYLGRKSYLFANNTAAAQAKPQRKCVSCGNDELTSFDRVCPKCKKELA